MQFRKPSPRERNQPSGAAAQGGPRGGSASRGSLRPTGHRQVKGFSSGLSRVCRFWQPRSSSRTVSSRTGDFLRNSRWQLRGSHGPSCAVLAILNARRCLTHSETVRTSELEFFTLRKLTVRAGMPATMAAGGTSDNSTEQAPTMAPRPIRTPGPTKARAAIQHSASMAMADATNGNETSRWSCVPAHR